MSTLISAGTLRTVIQVKSGGIVRKEQEFAASTDPQIIKQFVNTSGGRVLTDLILLESEGIFWSGPQRLLITNDIDLDAQVASLDRSQWSDHVVVTRIITLAAEAAN